MKPKRSQKKSPANPSTMAAPANLRPESAPPAPVIERPATTTVAPEEKRVPAPAAVASTLAEQKKPTPVPLVAPAGASSYSSPPPPTPLLSIGDVLDAIHLEIPPAKLESASSRPAPTPVPVFKPVAPVAASAPALAAKPVEAPKPVAPAAPTLAKAPAPREAEKKPAVKTVALSPAPTPLAPVATVAPVKTVKSSEAPKPASPPAPAAPVEAEQKKINEPVIPPPAKFFSEEQIVKDLPVMKEPEPKTVSATPAPTPEPPPPTRYVKPMFVVMITPEMAPVAKVGGLGDVTFGLARELEMRGNAVEVILPKYDCMRYHHIWGLSKAYEHLQVPWFGGVIDTTVWFGFVHGRKCYFIDPHSQDKFFNRGVYYGQPDDVMRFAFFCRAAMEFLLKTGKHPDVIHCHDWQTALVPVLLWEMYQHLGMRHPRVCFTIHNFKHQGLTGEQVLRATGLNRPEHFFNYERLRDNHKPQELNLMKGGIVYSNFVTTVSPRHAWEAKDGGQAFGLEPTLNTHHQKYGGVLNGLDYEMFNPEKDPHIPSHFSAKTIEKKYENKNALRKRLWLADSEKPIIAFIGRLDPQKGPELVRHAIFYALNNRAQFVLLGESPDKTINDHFWGLKKDLNDSPDCHLEIGYSDELAHLIYAGADMMVVPSRFEPCGLTQLISLRYGTVPIVRSVGGLADTVFDKDYSNRPLHERNGYVFHDENDAGLESALSRALGCYYQFPDHFRHLMVNGMNCDYSWNHPGQHYMDIYDYIREK